MTAPITRSQESAACRLFMICLLKTRPTLLVTDSIVKRFRVNTWAMFETIANIIDQYLGHPTAIRAIIGGFCLSAGATQYLKFRPVLQGLTDLQYRTLVRLFAFVSAFLATWLLWPSNDALAGAIVGLAVGSITPVIYRLVMHKLYCKSSNVEVVISGRPTSNAIVVCKTTGSANN